MANNIKCKVEECVYNKHGLCSAENIEVMSSSQNMCVSSSEGTCCQTFKPKNNLC